MNEEWKDRQETEAAEQAARKETAPLAQAEADAEATREADLETREAALERRELKLWAMDALKEKGLSQKLAELLDYESREACEASVKLVEEVMREAVGEAVAQRIARSRSMLNRGASGETALMARVRGVMGLK